MLSQAATIPFYQITAQGIESRTPEQRLAQRLAHLPSHTKPLEGSLSVAAFVRMDHADAVGLIFDSEFWYAPACWQRWLAALARDGLQGRLNVPLGNQEPDWREGVSLPVYLTLRGLEQAADNLQAERWIATTARRPVCFCAVILPLAVLQNAPPDMPMRDLPRYWSERQHPVRLFGGAWLHAFNALQDTGCRHDLLEMLGWWHGRVLELGCAQGLMARTSKQRGDSVVWIGLDYNFSALKAARPNLDLAIRADAAMNLPFSDKTRFDRVVCGDFLEHLAYPWRFLAHLRTFMAPDGLLVASFPNIGHWSVIEDLLAGRWDETPSGIFCVTHLRFGTRTSWQGWFERAGWEIKTWEAERLAPPADWAPAMSRPGLNVDRESLATLRYRLVAGVAP